MNSQKGGGFFSAGYSLFTFFFVAFIIKTVLGGGILDKSKVVITVVLLTLLRLVPVIGGIDCMIPF